MIQLMQAKDSTPQPWRNGGGQTRELFCWPSAADWQLRISRADIEKDGPFSAFPGVQRWFAVLEGAGVVLQMPQGPCTLRPGDAPFAFDGGSAPGCALVDGSTQDLNVMVQHGSATMRAVGTAPWSEGFHIRSLYTVHAGRWSDTTHTLAVPSHSLLWMVQADPTARANAWTFQANPDAALHAFWIGFTPQEAA